MENVKLSVCPTPAGCKCSNSGEICSAGQWNRLNFFFFWKHGARWNKVSLGPPENRGEDAGIPRAAFKQCWFVREEAEHTRICLPTRVLNIAKLGPGRSPRNLQRKKESARRRNLKPGQNQKKKLDEKDTAKEHGAHGEYMKHIPIILLLLRPHPKAMINNVGSWLVWWCFYGKSLGFLWGSYGIPMGVPWCFYDVSVGELWDSCRNPMSLWDSYGVSVRFLWQFHDISMVFLWGYYGMSIESKLKSIENNFKLNWNQMKTHWK